MLASYVARGSKYVDSNRKITSLLQIKDIRPLRDSNNKSYQAMVAVAGSCCPSQNPLHERHCLVCLPAGEATTKSLRVSEVKYRMKTSFKGVRMACHDDI